MGTAEFVAACSEREGCQIEWHLLRFKSLQQFEFSLWSWLGQPIITSVPSFYLPGFNASGAITDAVTCYRVEQILIDMLAVGGVVFACECNELLEGLQRLHGAFEANRSGMNLVFGRSPVP